MALTNFQELFHVIFLETRSHLKKKDIFDYYFREFAQKVVDVVVSKDGQETIVQRPSQNPKQYAP